MSVTTSKLVISLIDNVTGPAKGVGQSLKGLGASAKDVAKLEQIGKFRELQKVLITSRQQFAAAQTQVKKLAEEIAAVDKPTREMQRAFTAAQRGVKSAAADFRQQASAIKASRSALESAGIPLSKIASEEARLRSAITATTAAIQNQTRAHRVLTGVRTAAGKVAGNATAQTVGGIAGMATGAAAVSFAKRAITMAADFDIAVRSQRAFLDLKEAEQKPLLQQAVRIGQDTRFTNLDVVKAQTEVMQGLPSNLPKAQVALGITEHAQYYAQALHADMTTGAEAIKSFLQTTGRDMSTVEKALSEARSAANMMIRMSKLGGMKDEDIRGFLKFGAPSGHQAGLSNETIAALGIGMKRAGFRGDESGVATRAVASRLVAPTGKGLAALATMGVDYNKFTKMPGGMSADNFATKFQQDFGKAIPKGMRARIQQAIEGDFKDKDGNEMPLVSDRGQFTSAISDIVSELFPKTKKGKVAAQDARAIAKKIGEFHKLSVESVDTEGLLKTILDARATLAQLNAIFSEKHGGKIGAVKPDEFATDRQALATTPPDFGKKISDDIMAGLGGSLERMKGSVETFTQAMGQANEGLLKLSFDKIGSAFDWVSNLSKEGRQAATALGAIGALGVTGGGIKLLMEGFGLKGSAVALTGSAEAITAAAARLGATGPLKGAATGAATSVATGAAASGAAGAAGGAAATTAARSAWMRGLMFGGSVATGAAVAYGTYEAIELLHNVTKEFEGKNLRQRRGDITGARRQSWNEERARLGLPPLGKPSLGVAPLPPSFKPGALGTFKDVPLKVQLDPIDDQIEGPRALSEQNQRIIDLLSAIDLANSREPIERQPAITPPAAEPDRTPTGTERAAPAPLGRAPQGDARPPTVRVPTTPAAETPIPRHAPREVRPSLDGLSDAPIVPRVDTTPLDDAAEKARQTGETMKQSLDVDAKPEIDVASLTEAIRLAQEFESTMRRIASMTARPTIAPNIQTGGATPTSGSAQRASEAVRTAFADYGIRDV